MADMVLEQGREVKRDAACLPCRPLPPLTPFHPYSTLKNT
jgi:hypothetical protein